MSLDRETLTNLTADIASAHVSNNVVPVSEMAALITKIFDTLHKLDAPIEEAVPEKPKAAVSVRASIKPDHLISMIDGKPYKMLKRHLFRNGYTPESYRATFNLPSNYPMVATEYAEMRRALAKEIGLGRKPQSELARPVSKRAAAKPIANIVDTQSEVIPLQNNQKIIPGV